MTSLLSAVEVWMYVSVMNADWKTSEPATISTRKMLLIAKKQDNLLLRHNNHFFSKDFAALSEIFDL